MFQRVIVRAGILYASKDSHYSVFKAARMYRMEAVQVIPSCLLAKKLLAGGPCGARDFLSDLREHPKKIPPSLLPTIRIPSTRLTSYLYGIWTMLKPK